MDWWWWSLSEGDCYMEQDYVTRESADDEESKEEGDKQS